MSGVPTSVGASQDRMPRARILQGLSLIATLDVVDAAAASATALRTAQASVATATQWVASDLVSGGKTALLACPRQLRFTVAGSTASDVPATATVVGWTKAGRVTEVLTLPQTATTVDSENFFTSIETIDFPAGDGTGGTVALGFTAALGLPVKAQGRGASGAVFPILQELVDGAAPTAGALTSPATHKPFGSYTAHSSAAPDASRDHIVRYECEANARW